MRHYFVLYEESVHTLNTSSIEHIQPLGLYGDAESLPVLPVFHAPVHHPVHDILQARINFGRPVLQILKENNNLETCFYNV